MICDSCQGPTIARRVKKHHWHKNRLFVLENVPVRSRNPITGQKEYLHVLVGVTFDGVPVYTKGKLLKKEGKELFYVFVSSKKSTP